MISVHILHIYIYIHSVFRQKNETYPRSEERRVGKEC